MLYMNTCVYVYMTYAYVSIPQFLYPLIHQQTLMLFLYLDYVAMNMGVQVSL